MTLSREWIMSSRIESYIDPRTNEHVFTVRLTEQDLAYSRKLDEFDQALLRECEGSTSLADKVLALETIVRRMEQGVARETGVSKW